MSNFNTKTYEQHAQMILDAINDERITDEMVRDGEVHNEVFNTDYFIIGYYQGEQWIKENFDSVFNAISIVLEWEENTFGEVTTKSEDINGEKIANLLSYICGEEVIAELGAYDFETVEELKEAVTEYIEA